MGELRRNRSVAQSGVMRFEPCRSRAHTIVSLTVALAPHMRQPTFERAESELIKPSHHCIDLANFAVALKEVEQQNGARSRRSSAAFEVAPAADKSDAPEL
eukprot:371049-Prymnesium_polylepis.1